MRLDGSTACMTIGGDKVRLLLTHRASGDDLKEIGSFASGRHIHWAMLIALPEGKPRPQFWSQYHQLKPIYCRMTTTDPDAGCISSRA